MADVAYDYIATHKVAIPFKELWAEVSKETGVSGASLRSSSLEA